MKKLIATLLLFFAVTLNAQSNGVAWYSTPIDSGETTTSTLDVEGDNLKLISIFVDSTNWTSANLTMQSYNPIDQVWSNVLNDDGTAYTITIGALTAPVEIILKPYDMAGFEKVRFVSSVAQDVGAINIKPKLRPY